MTKKQPVLYPCPVCKEEFTANQVRRNNKQCPHCDIPVVSKRVKIEGKMGMSYIYEVVGIQQIATRPRNVAALVPESDWELKSDYGAVPEKWQLKENKQSDGRKQFRVIYHSVRHTGWVYCPDCYTRMFQNTTIVSGLKVSLPGEPNIQQGHRCRKCKSDVEFIFKT